MLKIRRTMDYPRIALATLFACLGAGQINAQPICKPAITVKQVAFSEMINLKRIWTASLEVDASSCATTSGLYSIGFVRRAENAPEAAFVEPFIWRLGQTRVVVEFWADESVERYWIENVASCPCRSQ